MWEKTGEFTIVVILTKDTINVAEMTAMCGRFASHVEVIEGSPVDLISSIACLYYPSRMWPALAPGSSTPTRSTSFLGRNGRRHSSLLSRRENQKKAWVRLVVSALETNFFLYRSDLGWRAEEDSP